MSRTRRKPPRWLEAGALEGFYKWAENRNAHKTGFIRVKAKQLARSERRQAKALAKKGVEKTGNPHTLARAWWLD